jgi:hypothetical protein
MCVSVCILERVRERENKWECTRVRERVVLEQEKEREREREIECVCVWWRRSFTREYLSFCWITIFFFFTSLTHSLTEPKSRNSCLSCCYIILVLWSSREMPIHEMLSVELTNGSCFTFPSSSSSTNGFYITSCFLLHSQLTL